MKCGVSLALTSPYRQLKVTSYRCGSEPRLLAYVHLEPGKAIKEAALSYSWSVKNVKLGDGSRTLDTLMLRIQIETWS